jgi:hypothetical protein
MPQSAHGERIVSQRANLIERANITFP